MTNFQHGLVFSLATSIVTSLTLIGKIVKEKGPNEDFPVIRSIICLVAIPLIVFPIVNFILNAYFSFREDRIKEFISYEFSQILVWRISSVWHSVISLGSYNIFKKPTFSFVNPVYEFYKKYPEVGKLPDIGKIGSTHMYVLSSKLFYLIALFFLGFHYVTKGISNFSSMLSFSIFFIFDDWNIFSFYYFSLKGRTNKFHIYRIDTFNILIVITALLVCIFEFEMTIESYLLISILILLIISFLTIYLMRNFDKIKDIVLKNRPQAKDKTGV